MSEDGPCSVDPGYANGSDTPDFSSPCNARSWAPNVAIHLHKRGGRSESMFGIGYRACSEALFVTSIVRGSILEARNAGCTVSEALCVGDQIVAVNGKRLPRGMIDELHNADQVRLDAVRCGPRWHLEGVIAESTNRLSAAIEQGNSVDVIAHDPSTIVPVQFDPLPSWAALLLLVSVLVPNVLVVTLFSDMGVGLTILGLLAPAKYNSMGSSLVCVATLFAIIMHIVDWSQWERRTQKIGIMLVTVYAMCLGAVLKYQVYPALPLAIMLFHLPAGLGIHRKVLLTRVLRRSFYGWASICIFLVAFLMLVSWLGWLSTGHWWNEATKARLAADSKDLYDETMITVNRRVRALDFQWDCHEQDMERYDFEFVTPLEGGPLEQVRTEHQLTSEESAERSEKCGHVKACWFLQWSSPLIAAGVNMVLAVFCAINALIPDVGALHTEKIMKHFMFSISSIVVIMYGAASIAGSSMNLTSTFLTFCTAALTALFAWVYLEIGHVAIHTTILKSKYSRQILEIATHDYTRATAVLCFAGLSLAALVIELIHQRARRIRGMTDSKLLLTPQTYKVLDAFQHWRWSRILAFTNYMCIIHFVFMVGVARATYIFLSWLNEALSNVPLGLVCVLFVLIGFTMFMLPPVPGFPVYITGGIIISSRARDGPGFWNGMVMAIFLGLFIKLVACSGQYGIGYFLGKSVKVQQLCGVDKVLMRAVEKILQRPGLQLSKVCILVGGPDWPTSVICGILKLNLLQVLWGTVPVIAISTPCVLAGALLAGGPDGANADPLEKASWETMSVSMSAVAFLVQAASGVVAMYFIQQVVARDFQELSQARPEHEPVRKLTMQEEAFAQIYDEATSWERLSVRHRMLLVVPTALFDMAFYMFQFCDNYLFRDFRVDSSIGASFENGGLQGDALNIIRAPIGYFPLLLFFTACVLHMVTASAMNSLAKQEAACRNA